MAENVVEELRVQAREAKGPSISPVPNIRLGGVDPLGLRQINFDLMDQVLPGLNNVARHIRPFMVVTWAWRRAIAIAQRSGRVSVSVDAQLRDFVDRIEVIYVWSQLLRDPNADLPGREVLGPILKARQYPFGGEAWKKRREIRENSTSLMAAINYGPGLRSMGWLTRHPENPKVMEPAAWANPALDALDRALGEDLKHDAFSSFGKVTVKEDEVFRWGKAWALEKYTKSEQRVFAEALFGSKSEQLRRLGMELAIAASPTSSSVAAVRRRMAGPPSRLRGPDTKLATVANWRRVQCRQLFRLCLETVFFWVTLQLGNGPMSSQRLVSRFMKQAIGARKFATTAKWIGHHYDEGPGPVELLQQVESALQGDVAHYAPAVMRGLAFCLMSDFQDGTVVERHDRLPLRRARMEFEQRLDTKPFEFMRHMLESWLFAQHAYWSIGRGLADARARGKTILRLKVVLEDGGWTLTPGVASGSFPRPTADRLGTALSLAHECGFIGQVEV
ncbi:septum formation inhibitor-activating ATPase [Bradyrhizobium sp. CW9]|uniref:septum formation inhibitor-activating ATPase n=1 Tax=Bradyrhizobium sp. CW9 TaxID=2782689 RepID=UPI001FFBA7C9|nr:septum formation inhibitor-activating ATPase [Bradyrhizobium sp. CW9]MCK1333283.1 septum formation inhibitor-activating ATPase [Bradyrhizobium sp. CW9]